MKGKYLRKLGGFALAALMLSGIVFVSPSTAEAQGQRRVIVRRPYSYRLYRRFDVFGYDRWGYDRFGFDRFGRDRWGNERFGANPWSPYGSRYCQYVFDNSEKAVNQGYKDGFKTGKDDGKKRRATNLSARITTMTLASATMPRSTGRVSQKVTRTVTAWVWMTGPVNRPLTMHKLMPRSNGSRHFCFYPQITQIWPEQV